MSNEGAVADRRGGDLRNYMVVTGAYWADTIADGAIRVLVLFYFYELGFSPLQVASLFLFYEVFGIITNLVGGYIAARWGLKSTLLGGLSFQLLALAMLAGVLVWQCSKEPPRSGAHMAREPAAAAPIQVPPGRQAESRPVADAPQQGGPSPSEKVIKPANAAGTPAESRRRAEEAMRILAPNTPEFEPLPGTKTLSRDEQ